MQNRKTTRQEDSSIELMGSQLQEHQSQPAEFDYSFPEFEGQFNGTLPNFTLGQDSTNVDTEEKASVEVPAERNYYNDPGILLDSETGGYAVHGDNIN